MSQSPIANHDKQKVLWKDNSRFLMLCAGRRFGKSIYGIEWLLAGSDQPLSHNCYVGPTRQQAKAIAWEYMKSRVFEMKWRVDINESELTITRANKSKITIMSAEKEDRFRGLKFDRIVLDEFSEYRSRTIWTQAIRPTLSDTIGSARFIFTPKGFNNAYELYQQAKTLTGWAAYSYKTVDSPFFQTAEGLKELEEAKATLSDRDYNQEYNAVFESFSGKIYHAFDRVNCNVDYEFNKDLPVIIGMDFNRSPMSAACYQLVAGVLIQFNEVFLRVGDTQQTCEEIKRRWPNSSIIIRPDATGSRRTSNSSLSDFDIIRSFGFIIESDNINPRRIDRWASTNRAYDKGLVKMVIKNCPISCKDREVLVYIEGSCEPDLKDPFLGHMSDASDYAIYRQYPILTKSQNRSGNWA
jgi:hypothetical protein